MFPPTRFPFQSHVAYQISAWTTALNTSDHTGDPPADRGELKGHVLLQLEPDFAFVGISQSRKMVHYSSDAPTENNQIVLLSHISFIPSSTR